MPNTTPSDLDREALEKAWQAFLQLYPKRLRKCFENALGIYLSALPRASGMPEAEAVAWCYKPRSGGEWEYFTGPWREPWNEKWIGEPLYASPPPVAAPSGGALEPCTLNECPPGLFLFDEKHLGVMTEYTTLGGEGMPQRDAYVVESGEYFWGGTVTTQERAKLIVRPIEMTPPSPIASEPKDAGSGEWQEISGLGLIKAVTAYDRYWENHDDASEAVRCAIEAYLAFTRTAPSGAKP